MLATLERLSSTTGFAALAPLQLALLLFGLALVALAWRGRHAPWGALLLPFALGALFANLPGAGLAAPGGPLAALFRYGVALPTLPLVLLVGLGASLDLGALIARPRLLLLGLAAQLGAAAALFGLAALAVPATGADPGLASAAALALTGAGDGLAAIFLGGQLAPAHLDLIALVAYAVTVIAAAALPAVLRGRRRPVPSTAPPAASPPQPPRPPGAASFIAPLGALLVGALLAPAAAPLLAALTLGALWRASGLGHAAAPSLVAATVALLGLAVGARLGAPALSAAELALALLCGLFGLALTTASSLGLARLLGRPRGPGRRQLALAGLALPPPLLRALTSPGGSDASRAALTGPGGSDAARTALAGPGASDASRDAVDPAASAAHGATLIGTAVLAGVFLALLGPLP